MSSRRTDPKMSSHPSAIGRRVFLRSSSGGLVAATLLPGLASCTASGAGDGDGGGTGSETGGDTGLAPGDSTGGEHGSEDSSGDGSEGDSTGAGPVEGGVNISVTRSEGVAPAGIIFTVEVDGFDAERPFHDLRYKWTFSDEGIYDRLAEDLPWGRDRNIAYGPVVSHAFSEAGSYEVICEVTDGETTAVGTITITVDDPEIVYADNRTVVISPIGDFADAPPGALTATSVEEVFPELDRNQDLRVLFHRGEDHDTPIPFFADFQSVQLGAYGEGDPPIVRSGVNFRECVGEIAVWGIDFVGRYDPTQPSDTQRGGADLALNSAVHTTIYDCSMVGGDIPIRPGDEVVESLVVGNTDVRDWFNFGLLQGGGGWVGLCGVSMRQHPRTVRGSGKGETEPPFYSDHGPFRLSRPSGPVCFNLVDLFTNSTWAGAETTLQPTIRWNAGGVASPQQFSMDRVRSEGWTLAFGTSTSNSVPGACEVVVDKFHHTTTMSPAAAVSIAFGGTTLRNGIIVQADVPVESSTGLRDMIGIGSDEEQAGNADSPMEVYSCTIVDLRSPDNATNGSGTAERDFSPTQQRQNGEYYFANNLLYAPTARTPETSALPLDLSSRWVPQYPGRLYETDPFQPEFANPADTASLFVPQRGSSAIGASTGKAAIDDFFGALRPDVPSLGATEPV